MASIIINVATEKGTFLFFIEKRETSPLFPDH